MRIFLRTAVLVLFVLTPFAATGAPLRIPDPDRFCEELITRTVTSEINLTELAKAIATTVGRPEGVAEIEKALKPLEGKKIDYRKKVVDREFGGALRQILYYVYIDNLDFVYVRFNFKMTSTGWILANFNFKAETHELFPKDFSER